MRSLRWQAPAYLAAVLCGGTLSAAAERPRGLILISIDTLRADRLGAYGAGESASPALDAFARDSIVFEKASANATWTVPSHATMLTGLFPSGHNAGASPPGPSALDPSPRNDLCAFSPAIPTLASRLHGRGYRTAGFYFGPVLDPRWGFSAGFDVYEPGLQVPVPASGRRVETTFSQAADWLAKKGDARPYFLFIHTYQVHRYKFSAVGVGKDAGCPLRGDMSVVLHEAAGITDPLCGLARDRYAAAVRCTDEAFGLLLSRLDAAGARDAVVIVTADHGEALCDPHSRSSLIGHGMPPYEQQIDVPLMIRLPHGRMAGRRSAAPASLVDIVPTALAALGEKIPGELLGEDLLGVGHHEAGPVFAESNSWQMVREGGMKYLRFRDGVEALYDLSADPAETRDLSADPERLPRLDALRARLREHLRTVSLGYHLVARGKKGDRFDIRVDGSDPIGYASTYFTEASDRFVRTSGGKTLTAVFTMGTDDDEDWLNFDAEPPFIGDPLLGVRPPQAAPSTLRLRVRRNGKPVAAGELLSGTRPALRDGELVLYPASRDEEVQAAGNAPEAAVVVWRRKDAALPGASAVDARLREALRAEGYTP